MKSTAKIDAKKFKAIKILLEAGSTYREAAEYMEISLSTVGRIAATDTYEEGVPAAHQELVLRHQKGGGGEEEAC